MKGPVGRPSRRRIRFELALAFGWVALVAVAGAWSWDRAKFDGLTLLALLAACALVTVLFWLDDLDRARAQQRGRR